MIAAGLAALDWLIDDPDLERRPSLADRERLVAARRRAVHVRPAADRGDGAAARRGVAPSSRPAMHRYRAAMERSLRLVPRRQRPRRRGRRSGARRLPRRSDATGGQPQRGRRVDAHVADRGRAHPGRPRGRLARLPDRRPTLEPQLVAVATSVTRPEPLFRRDPANPILTAADVPYPANSVFNPAAARVGDETILLVRVEDLRGISQLHVARSADGVTDWRFDPEPLLQADVDRDPEETWGCEDPRAHLAARARRMGDRLHRLQPPRAARRARDDAGLPERAAASGRSCRPRTRTRPCSRAGSTVAGR